MTVGIFSRRDKDGYDKKGFDRDGYDKEGFDKIGINKVTGTKFDEDGYDKDGYDKDEYDKEGQYSEPLFWKFNEQFAITSIFMKTLIENTSDFDAMVTLAYNEPTKIRSKLFFSHDKKTGIYSKEFESFSNNNVVHFHIETAGKQSNAAWIKPKDTGKTQGDNFEAGYTLIVSLNKNDSELNSFLIKKLGKINFGCLPSEYSLLCHLDENYPTDERAKELLQEVVELFNC